MVTLEDLPSEVMERAMAREKMEERRRMAALRRRQAARDARIAAWEEAMEVEG